MANLSVSDITIIVLYGGLFLFLLGLLTGTKLEERNQNLRRRLEQETRDARRAAYSAISQALNDSATTNQDWHVN